MKDTRIQKFASDCGLMSRRAAEKEIEAGNFTVNGLTASIGDKVDTETDVVKYKNVRLRPKSRKFYIMLNKPAGYVTTSNDELGRKNVCELVEKIGVRLYPVGRLDKDSEGLLLFTNDGDFAARLTHPRYHYKKQYLVTVRGYCHNDKADKLRAMRMLDDEPIQPVEVRIAERDENSSKLMFTLSEGKNRQIRRMCEEAGLVIMQLKRLAVGNVRLGTLETGCFRHLTGDEIKELSKQ